MVGCIVNTTKRCMQCIHDEDIFKARVNIKFSMNMGTVHVCPYIGEVTGELRGNWVDSHQVDAWIQILLTAAWKLPQEKPDAPKLTKELKVHLKGDDNRGKGVGGKRMSPN